MFQNDLVEETFFAGEAAEGVVTTCPERHAGEGGASCAPWPKAMWQASTALSLEKDGFHTEDCEHRGYLHSADLKPPATVSQLKSWFSFHVIR